MAPARPIRERCERASGCSVRQALRQFAPLAAGGPYKPWLTCKSRADHVGGARMRCNGPTRCRGPRRRRPVCAWTTGRGRGGPCLDVIFMPHGWPAGRHGTLSRKPRQLAFRCVEVTTACSRRGSIESNEGVDCGETALREVGPDLPGQAILTGQQRHLFVRQRAVPACRPPLRGENRCAGTNRRAPRPVPRRRRGEVCAGRDGEWDRCRDLPRPRGDSQDSHNPNGQSWAPGLRLGERLTSHIGPQRVPAESPRSRSYPGERRKIVRSPGATSAAARLAHVSSAARRSRARSGVGAAGHGANRSTRPRGSRCRRRW